MGARLATALLAGMLATAGCGRDASQSRWWQGSGDPAARGDYGGTYYSNLLDSWMGAPVGDLFRDWGEPDWDTNDNGVREVGYEDEWGDWGFFVNRRGIIYDGYYTEYGP